MSKWTEKQREWLETRLGIPKKKAETETPVEAEELAAPSPPDVGVAPVSYTPTPVSAVSTPAPAAEPQVYVRGYRVKEADVLRALGMLGDDVVADFQNGRMSKDEAYEITARRLRDLDDMGAVRLGSLHVLPGRMKRWTLRF